MKKELKRIKTNYTLDILEIINNLEGPEWDNIPFSIKVEKLLTIALAYQPYWEEDKVFETIKGE
jgi:hypothetical protein